MPPIKLLVAATLLAASVSATAETPENGRYDRQNASRGEVERSMSRLQGEKRDVQDARRYGNERDVRREQRDVDQARQEYRQDARDLRGSDDRRNEQYRANGKYWNQGRQYAWNRPDPRYNGYYANNYYRSGNYRPTRLASNDRIYRGTDNRYYCRRSDGTTGLIIGAVGGGVLGNVIAPGGSKTLGSILGGSLGAVLGNSIDRNNVTCR